MKEGSDLKILSVHEHHQMRTAALLIALGLSFQTMADPIVTGNGTPIDENEVRAFLARPGVIPAGPTPSLSNRQYFYQDGYRVPTGQCAYNSRMKIPKGTDPSLAIGQQPVAEDPANCRRIVVRGSMPLSNNRGQTPIIGPQLLYPASTSSLFSIN